MQLNPDFSDLFSTFNAANVRYLLVGGYAYSFYAEPRATKDLDVWVEPSTENAQAVWQALGAFGAPLSRLSLAEFAKPDIVVQIGVAPNRIDILTSIEGVSFDEGWANRTESYYGDVAIFIIGVEQLIQNKRAVGRPHDLADVERLTR
jgi:hypothetical protein